MSFQPDYRNIVQAARNETPARIPLYDHKVGDGIISKIMGEKVGIPDYVDVNKYVLMTRTVREYRGDKL